MPRKNKRIARRARIAVEKWREYFKYNIDLYHEMHTFVLGQQWTDDEEEMLKTFKKVPLVSNKLATMSNTLLGEQQQNTPQIQVVPMTNCDEKTAYLRELVVKEIMFSNRTAIVYQVAASQAAIGGHGAFCVDTEYSHSRSFDLDICYQYFKDATRCYWDVGAETINKTDGQHAGYISRMTREKFREVYGEDIEEAVMKTFAPTASKEEIALAVEPNSGNDPFSWADDNGITIIDHYERKYEPDTLYKLSDGSILNQEEMDELIVKSIDINAEQSQMMDISSFDNEGLDQENIPIEPHMTQNPDMMTLWHEGNPVRIEDKRNIKRSKIMHYKIAGEYILEQSEFPSEQLPIVFVDQNSYYDKNGKQVCRSFFGDAKDTQRYINYLRTQSAFILKISRYDQFIGSKKNVQGLDTQRDWKDPGSVKGLLAYDESPNGHKPEQIRPPELSESLFTQYQLAIEDLYTSTGLYPSRMGQQGNEVSGAAIDARTRQGSYPTFIFYNSINRAIATGGEILNEMIPKVYDAQRVITLMTPDEGLKNITLNKQSDEYGELIENDIRKGTYQVRLKPGASYEGQKELALESLKQLLAADPGTFKLVADLYAENLPLANTLEIKNRLKTIVPPQIVQAGKTGQMPDNSGQLTPEQQAQQAQAEAAQQEAKAKQEELRLKSRELDLKEQEIILKAKAEIQKLQTERLEVAGELEEQKLRYLAETDRTQTDKEISNAENLVKILTHKVDLKND